MSTTPEFPEPKRRRLTPSMASYPPPSSAEPLPCPRCNSTKTKFCYYNNYNLSQPRHFCRGCRRYWTQGGTLRNIPVGGGTRKKPRLAHHSASASNSSGSPSSSSLTHETTSVVEKPDLPSDQTQQKQLQLMNLNNNVGSEGGVSLPSMMMMYSQEQQPGFLSLGGYLYGSGYGSGFVHGFQQGYGYGARVDFPAEIVYGAPVVPSSGLEMNTWQMAVADHGGQGGGLVDLPEVQILNNSMPAVIGGGALKDEKVADSSTSSRVDFPAF